MIEIRSNSTDSSSTKVQLNLIESTLAEIHLISTHLVWAKIRSNSAELALIEIWPNLNKLDAIACTNHDRPPDLQRQGEKKISQGEVFLLLKMKQKELFPKGPLLTGLFDTIVQVAKQTSYNLSSEEKAFFKGMTFEEVVNMAFELHVRVRICMALVVGTPKGTASVEELQASQ